MLPALPLLLLHLPVAVAQEEVCTEEVTSEDWLSAMTAIEAAIEAGNGVLAGRIADDTSHVVRCAVEVMPPGHLARLARQRSALGFYAQDDIETERWAHLAREAVGWAPWPEGLVVADAYFEVADRLKEPTRSGPDDKGLAPPRGGAILLDGRLLTRPEASVDVPHLVQVVDKKQRVILTRWQDGAAFDDDLLGPPGEVATPKWYVAPPPPVPRPPRSDAPPPVASAEKPAAGPATLTFDMSRITTVCQWRGEPSDVEIDKDEVRINGQLFRLDTDTYRAEYRDALRLCGEFRAVRHFDRWRRASRSLFGSANKHRDAMRTALITKEPVHRVGELL